VAIFNTREAYMTYGELTLLRRQEFTLGYFMPAFRELLLFEDVDLDDTLQTLYHEAFHEFMSRMVPRPPYWYNEGIAEYMAGLRIEEKDGSLRVTEKARIQQGRLQDLRILFQIQQVFSFQDIMNQTPSEFYSGLMGFKYAQAWSMLHYFYEFENGKHRAKIERYFELLRDRKPAREVFDEVFGKDWAELEMEWRAYVEKLETSPKP